MVSTEFKGVGLHDTAFRDAIREDSRQTTPSRGVTPRKKFAVEANVESRVKAASVQWQVTGGTAAQVGYAVYLVSAINSEWTSVADIAADAAALGNNTSGTLAKNGRVYTVAQQVANGTGITTDSMKSVYAVTVSGSDATEYNYVQQNLSALVYGGAATPPGTFSTTTTALLAGQSGSFSSVPEPTSGLLLLVGMAGLALRRKQK